MQNLRNYKFFIYILIFFTSCIPAKTYIVLPFKIHHPNNYENITKLFNELLDNKLIITLSFGSQQKNIDFYASMNEYIYYLEECSKNNIDNYYITSSEYDFKESKTFNNKSKIFAISQLKTCFLGEDKIYLYEDINLSSLKEMSLMFYYGSKEENFNMNDKSNKLFGLIGFKQGNDPFRLYEYEDFISVLKKNKLINSYTWYIHYFEEKNKINNFDGAIILDILNSKFFNDFPSLKKEDDYNTINAKDLALILAWTFNFDKIYYFYNETKYEIDILVSGLAFETDFIHCPEVYFESIKKNFFNKLIDENICVLNGDRYYYIYCEKNGFEKYKKNFPSLFFKSYELNKTYELNSDDLFKDCGSYYFFMIIRPKYGYKVWTLGKIFMKKNNFYFDNNKKLIGYFDKVDELEINNQKNKNDKNFFDKIKYYIFIIIGIIIGIFIGKKIREKARKLRANELEDNYEYLENDINKEEKNSNDFNNNINLNNTNSNSNYKEIGSSLYNISE